MATVTEPTIDFLQKPMRLYIDGVFVETDGALATINPATGQTLAMAPLASEREVDAAVEAAARAFETWRSVPPTQRARLMWSLADLLEANKDEFATIEVLDNGKPMWEAQAVDVALTIELLRYYAGWTTKLAGDVLPNSIPGMLTLGKREPVGVVAAITPWNFPLLEVAYKLGPALAAGCTVVVKPSELAPLSTLRLMELIDEAGVPPGVVNVVIGGPEVGASLVKHPAVAQDRVHGPDRDRQGDHAGLGGRAEEGDARAGRQEPQHRLRRREPRRRPERRASAAHSSTKGRPASRARGSSSRRRRRRAGARASPTGAVPCGSATGSTRRRRWGRSSPRTHRRQDRRLRRRRRPRAPSRGGGVEARWRGRVLRRAHRLLGRQRTTEDRPGGDLRSRALRDPLGGRGRAPARSRTT